MKKFYLNYADANFDKQKKFALRAAKLFGGFDKIIGLSPNDIDDEFFNRFKKILEQKRGGGYWLWKPYVINKTLSKLAIGDYLFYSDAGAFFLKNVDILINELDKSNQDIMGFELPLIEEQWTKKELFLDLGCNEDRYINSNQMLASYMLIKKTDKSINFFKEYLIHSCNEINITDKHIESLEQYDAYIEHRHDQSIFSLLYKKYNLRPFKDPSQLGKYPIGYLEDLNDTDIIIKKELRSLSNGRKYRINSYIERYPMVLYLNKKKHPLVSLAKYYIKVLLYKFKLYKGAPR
jgi:hypothetical protein